jgi:beta-1,4-mannosyl-glycoprotein beta-1,4-N-acetylglucosaminyltransferase
MSKRIFSCFPFFNELDLLEIRLTDEYAHVDKFVIVESPVTFQGDKKPLHFSEHKQRYFKFLDKITHIIVRDMPVNKDPWVLEKFQRAAIWRGLDEAAPDDIIVVSDADELIREDAYQAMRENDGYFQLVTPMYEYYMNLEVPLCEWNKVFAFNKRMRPEIPCFDFIRYNTDKVFAQFGKRGYKIENAGWHFSYLGGPVKVQEKLKAFSHNNGWFAKMANDLDSLQDEVIMGLLNGGNKGMCEFVPIDDSFPDAVITNQALLTEAGYIRDPFEALRALQHLAYRQRFGG